MNEKTEKEINLLKRNGSVCKRTETQTVSDITVADAVLATFFKILGNGAAKATKNHAIEEPNNPTGALELAADLSSWSNSLEAIAACAPSVIKIAHQGKGFYLGQIQGFFYLSVHDEKNWKAGWIWEIEKTYRRWDHETKNEKKTNESIFLSWYAERFRTINWPAEKKTFEAMLIENENTGKIILIRKKIMIVTLSSNEVLPNLIR